MDNNLLHQTVLALTAEWDLVLPETLTEEAILKLLAAKVLAIIARGPEPFFQLMYRLDISEKKVRAALNDPDVAAKVAKLIYDRQLQKIKSRKEHKKKNNLEDGDLGW